VGHSVPAAASLPRDEAALAATLEWMLAGIPQMCEPQLRTAPRQSVNLVFEGPAGGSWILAPGADLWTVTAGRDSSAPSAISNVHDFISWGTKRAVRSGRRQLILAHPATGPKGAGSVIGFVLHLLHHHTQFL
jgi:hypothetical protein